IINEEFAEYINSPSWNRPTFVDDDDTVFYTISHAAITPDLPTKESENSLNMGDEHLDTILETEKSSVEDLVPIPSESNDISEDECDLPVSENSSSQFTTFSNPLYETDDDFSSSDDESILEDDIPVGTFKTYSNPLFEIDEEIVSSVINPLYSEKLDDNVVNDHFDAESCFIESLVNHDTLIDFSPKINSFLDEFVDELALFQPIPPRIDEIVFEPKEDIRLMEELLYNNSLPRPPEGPNSKISDATIKSFSPSPIPVEDSDSLMEEIDIFLAPDDSIPPCIKSDDYDSEDIIF
ncbi:hypothetical protein Tco_0654384, partial [Tanacetum coccineum]